MYLKMYLLEIFFKHNMSLNKDKQKSIKLLLFIKFAFKTNDETLIGIN